MEVFLLSKEIMNEINSKRIFGLDILRSAAILIVIIGHSSYLVSDYFKSLPSLPLPDGVDLFFVLSGFLIGTILIKSIAEHQGFNFKNFIYFIKRRWFRTLPNYFLFLILNIILIYFGMVKGELNKYLVTYFCFFQNFFKPYDFLFWESWSLSIEEWFYFIFPLLLVLFFSIQKNVLKIKSVILITIFIFILLPLLYRIASTMPVHAVTWDLYYRKLVLTRLDTIGFGLLGALIKWFYPLFWSRIKNVAFILGIGLIIFIGSITFENNILFFKTFYYSLVGFSILLLLPKLESLKNETIPLKPFQFISKISFSMYLLHVPLLQILISLLSIQDNHPSIILYFIYWILVIILSALIYRYFEKPIMDLREKIRPIA